MTSAHWFLLVGTLLLTRGLTSSMFKGIPVTPAIVYLGVGVLIGPTVLNVFHFNPLKEAPLLGALTEVAVLISLFSAGIKMPVPVSLIRWRTPILLASVSMTVSVGMVAGFAYWLLGMPLGAGILLGAILAPTDPVLATDVQIRHPGDRDQLRFILTCEAGMNDGSAFPFVMLGLGLLGLHGLGEFGLRWALVDVLWATVAGIAIGATTGVALAHLGWRLRHQRPAHTLMDDFLGLGVIGVVYGLSLLVGAWGFLAVFFAAVALRQTELKLAGAGQSSSIPRQSGRAEPDVPDAHLEDESAPTVSGGSLIFKEHLERLSELMLVLLLGGTLFLNSWNWRAVALALFLFVVARPFSVLASFLGTRASSRIGGMVGWFGVRGIGSVYYLMYAIEHGLPEDLAVELIQLTLIAVSLSILVHGTTVKPLMSRFWRDRKRDQTRSASKRTEPRRTVL
jgi:sodium/hydrogen antiporter